MANEDVLITPASEKIEFKQGDPQAVYGLLTGSGTDFILSGASGMYYKPGNGLSYFNGGSELVDITVPSENSSYYDNDFGGFESFLSGLGSFFCVAYAWPSCFRGDYDSSRASSVPLDSAMVAATRSKHSGRSIQFILWGDRQRGVTPDSRITESLWW